MRVAWFGVLALGVVLAGLASPAAGQAVGGDGPLMKERKANPGAQQGPGQRQRERAKAKAKAAERAKAKAAGGDADGQPAGAGPRSGGPAGGPGGPGGGGDFMAKLYRSGNFRLVQSRVKSVLETNPDNADAHCMLGIAYENAGRYADAYTSLELGQGSTLCDTEGLGSWADTLHVFGHYDAAANVRMERLAMVEEPGVETQTWLNMVNDYRAAGRYDEAWDAAYQALALMPRGARVLTGMADLAMDEGDMDEAARLIWLAQQVEEPPPAARLTMVRYELLTGDLDAATQTLEAIQPRKNRIWLGSVYQAEVLRRSGDAEGAALVLEAKYLRGAEYPALLAEQAMVLADLGQADEAQDRLDRALAIYPSDPDVQLAERHVQRRQRRAGP